MAQHGQEITTRKTLLSWSSGKDSAWTLHLLQQDPGIELCGLFTTVNQSFQRVAMHGVRRELLEQQARALALPLNVLELPYPCSNADYEAIMDDFVTQSVANGIEYMAFGDLFLDDIRAYRERNLAGSGLTPLFPLWGQATDALAQQMIESGLRAYLSCVDPTQLDPQWIGQVYSTELLAALPAGVDPCGERGEFHTFVVDGPMFRESVKCHPGDVVERDGFVFVDLLAV